MLPLIHAIARGNSMCSDNLDIKQSYEFKVTHLPVPKKLKKGETFHNFIGNLVAGLIDYNMAPKKPSLNLEIIDLDKIKAIA